MCVHAHGFPREEYWSGLPFSSSWLSSQPRDWTHVSCTGIFFTAEPPEKPNVCVYMNHFTVRKVLCEKKNEDQPWENQPLKNLHQPTNRDVGPRQSFKMRLNQAFLFNSGIHKPWTIICYYKYNLTLPCQAHPLINSWWWLLCCNSRVEQSCKKKDCWLTKLKIFTIWFFTEYLLFGPSLF